MDEQACYMQITQIVYVEMLCKLNLLYNMESHITTLAMAMGHNIHYKSPTDSSQRSCHHILVGVDGAFMVVLLLSCLDAASISRPSGA